MKKEKKFFKIILLRILISFFLKVCLTFNFTVIVNLNINISDTIPNQLPLSICINKNTVSVSGM